jgi:hypothetical protein
MRAILITLATVVVTGCLIVLMARSDGHLRPAQVGLIMDLADG